ncbi:hypothetical protein DRO66_03770 [Candidatus Bathyarchaeota archaeon]|nr:MAG: hypothetical protein DRO66_03770 [Candidatus Bathyarchaeota archaeon]
MKSETVLLLLMVSVDLLILLVLYPVFFYPPIPIFPKTVATLFLILLFLVSEGFTVNIIRELWRKK